MSNLRPESLLLDVFGRTMQAVRAEGRWSLFLVGNEGKKRLVQDVVVPSELSKDELIGFLDDLYHEWATPAHPSVRRTASKLSSV